MKIFRLLLILYVAILPLYAQQGAQYNMYFHDHYYINPAAAGSAGLTVFNVTAKEFWLGFPESTPSIQSLVFHTRLKNFGLNLNRRSYGRRRREGRVGMGAMFYNDMNDPIRKTGLILTYAYHIRLQEANLSFGLSSNTYQLYTNTQDVLLKSPGDPILSELDMYYNLDVNTGIYLRARDYYFSLTVNNMLETKVQYKNEELFQNVGKEKRETANRQYNAFGGYLFKVNQKLTFEPSFLFQVEERSGFQKSDNGGIEKADNLTLPNTRMDMNTKWIYRNRFWAGAGISSNRGLWALNSFVGVISEQFDFGYSFQIPVNSELLQYSLGAHEIMFSLKFGHDRFNNYQRFYR